MNWPEIVVALMVFAMVALLVIAVGLYGQRAQVRGRVARVVGRDLASRRVRSALGAAKLTRFDSVIDSISKLSLPEAGWQDSSIRLRFVQAGLHDPNAPRYFYAIKSFMTLILPGLLLLGLSLFGHALPVAAKFSYVVLCAAAGYYLPDMYIRHRTASRLEEMQQALPDLIDLLVICTESGLGMDAAINRVARDAAGSSVTLAEEFYLTSLEIRAGAGRTAALKNMALRTNLEDLNGFVSMLVQADKFGTSLAESLRIQSDLMRVKRMQRAEEMAAKVPVKMLMPLIFFIFPALMIVLIGPAFLQIGQVFGK